MTHKFNTVISWFDGRYDSECEASVTVYYDRHKGWPQTLVDPADPASVEIVEIEWRSGDSFGESAFLENEKLLAECMQDWIDDDAAAEEYRAEARREDRMMERFERERRP